MALFILTWNPDRWGGDEWWEEQLEEFEQGRAFEGRWSTGARSSGIAIGDACILLRQGRDRGIVAAGNFTSECSQETHWSEEGATANYADILLDHLVPVDERVPTEALIAEVPEVIWNSLYSSGVKASEEAEVKILDLWESWDGGVEGVCLPDPYDEFLRLPDFEMWAVYILSTILAGVRPPAANQHNFPSNFGNEVIQALDEHLFTSSRPVAPALYLEFELPEHHKTTQSDWSDMTLVWPDRLLIIAVLGDVDELESAPRFQQLSQVDFPASQVDMVFVTDEPLEQLPTELGAHRYRNMTWDALTRVLIPLADAADDAIASVVEGYLDLLNDAGMLAARR